MATEQSIRGTLKATHHSFTLVTLTNRAFNIGTVISGLINVIGFVSPMD